MASFKIDDRFYVAAALILGCKAAAVKAVAHTESKNAGFDSQGRPIILFERHKFYKYAPMSKRDEWRREHSDICNPNAGGYGKSAAQWDRFSRAFRLDKRAAMMACSWGAFQEMGFNFADLGFDSVDQFVDAMKSGLEAQLAIFVKSIQVKGLTAKIRALNWTAFARGYNGPKYRENDYDNKMAKAYADFIDLDARLKGAEPLKLPTITDLKRKLTAAKIADNPADEIEPADATPNEQPTQNADAIVNMNQTTPEATAEQAKIDAAKSQPPVQVPTTEETGFLSKVKTTIFGIVGGTIALPAFAERIFAGEISAGTIELIKLIFPYVFFGALIALVIWYVVKKINNWKLTKLYVETNTDLTVKNIKFTPPRTDTKPQKVGLFDFRNWKKGAESIAPLPEDRGGLWKAIEDMTPEERATLRTFLLDDRKVEVK